MEISFNQRFGINTQSVKADIFPDTARNGLMYIFEKLVKKCLIQNNPNSNEGWASIYRETLRTAKTNYEEIDSKTCTAVNVDYQVTNLKWNEVYILCERVFKNLLSDNKYYNDYTNEWVINIELKEAQDEYTREINNLLSEENLPFIFEEGVFVRPGKAQTQKNINKAASVLIKQELKKTREHFNKALEFFSSPDKPDYKNAVKESLCSLELAAEIVSGLKISKDFSKEVLKISGVEINQIPSPIIGSMIKIFAYRGTGDGVAHGTSEGLRVTIYEAELVLSIVAAFITYLVTYFDSIKEDIPF